MINVLLNLLMSTALAVVPIAPRSDIATPDDNVETVAARGKPKVDHCREIYRITLGVVGNEGTAKCLLALFKNETTTCQVGLAQAKGNTGNPAAGYGLCTLESSPALRKGRGPDCQSIATAVQQIKCCHSIMRRTPTYFGGVNRGEVSRCH